jgi:hypothetical protein
VVLSPRQRAALEAVALQPDAALIALDMGRALGVALGRAGTRYPQSLTIKMSRVSDSRGETFEAIDVFMGEQLHHFKERHQPVFVAKEGAPHINGFVELNDSSDSARTTLGYHAIVERVCTHFRVPYVDEDVRTIRKHFVGRGYLARTEAKAAVLQRCKDLSYLPADCEDTDRADALAVWSWASVHIARRAPADLVLFGMDT